MRLLIASVAVFATFLGGCRTVWVHPEATAQKYEGDRYMCRYGEVRPTEEQLRRRALAASQTVPPEVIMPLEPTPPPESAEVNTGSGTNVNVQVDVGSAAPPPAPEPVVIPGHTPRRVNFYECMDVLGWNRAKRFGASERWATP